MLDTVTGELCPLHGKAHPSTWKKWPHHSPQAGEIWPWLHGFRITSSAPPLRGGSKGPDLLWTATQTHILGLGFAHPSWCHIYNILECSKRLVLKNNRHRIFMTPSNNKVFERSFDEGTVMMVYQKPETSSQINDTLQWTSYGWGWLNKRGALCDTGQHLMPLGWMRRCLKDGGARWDFCLLVGFVFLLINFGGCFTGLRGRCEGCGRLERLGRMIWNFQRIKNYV